MGNSKNRKVPQKQKASNNSKRKSSSDQKENVPKRENNKTIKPGPNDGIAMSKQLLLKKKTNVRTQRRSSSKPERICPNGKPLPSLAELEKMYEDSDDDDDQTPKTPTQKPKCTPSTPEKPIPTSLIEKNLISPSTINKITERLLGSIQKQNLPDPNELLEAASLLRGNSPPPAPIIPPKKRKKPEVPYIVGCKDRPKVIRKPNTNFCKGDDDYGVDASDVDPEETPTKRAKKSRIPNYTKSIFNARSDEIAEKLTKDDAGNLSDGSSDSNKTIEYDPTLFQNPRPHSFSPLPSTSTDSETFKKNDELFNESLKEINISKESTPKKDDVLSKDAQLTPEIMEDNVIITKQSTPIKKDDILITKETTLKKEYDVPIEEESELEIKENCVLIKEDSTKKIEDDIKIIEVPYETIEIEDFCDTTLGIQNTAMKSMDTDDIEIIEPVGLEVVNPKEKKGLIYKRPDDEDCMIITSSGTISNHNNPRNHNETTIVIDDEYSTINMEFDSINDEPIEIIDVDDIIAENKSILEKWKNNGAKELNNINTVVDVPTTYRNVSTVQTAVIPSIAVQTTSIPTTASTSLQAGVTPTSTIPIQENNRRQPSTSDNSRLVTFQGILDDFFETLQNRTANANRDFDSGSRVTSFFNSMISRIQTPRPTSNQTPRPTSNQTPRPTGNSITIPSNSVNTHMPAITNVYQNSISPVQNTDNRQRDVEGLCKSSSHSGTQQTSMSIPPPQTSLVPTRNIGDCPICLDPLSSSNGIASTICGHVFCLKCIQASVKTNGKKCPTCRKALKGAGGGYHQLYL